MDRWTVATVLALVATALLAGGAAVGVGGLLDTRPAVGALAFVAAVVAIVALGTARGCERSGTPYW